MSRPDAWKVGEYTLLYRAMQKFPHIAKAIIPAGARHTRHNTQTGEMWHCLGGYKYAADGSLVPRRFQWALNYFPYKIKFRGKAKKPASKPDFDAAEPEEF